MIQIEEVFDGLQSVGVDLDTLKTIDCTGKTHDKIKKEISKRVSLIVLHINKTLNVTPDKFQVSVDENINKESSTMSLQFEIEVLH
ncbi:MULTISPECIES: hypothetical protein [Bacillus]|uniref:Uncharacterized protein n=2 Tax=Bacillus TaxID=1386 RepID=A0A0M4FKC6_9BACI|nr:MULTISPECIES: hypothetical protein [Bacillus]ALC82167.1 hypothetical protein AM592_11680 [Bacillus gobiensis]MBP1080993.1 hypothetical protein [Bacillus capparidis]MED1095690.1 hypothetical protein [Bacillus capparidis]